MRRLASFLLLGVALVAGATDVWRWKDANGVVHYSDSPVPGAERVNVAPPPSGGGSRIPGPGPAESPAEAQPQVRYSRCVVSAPSNDEVFFAVDSVSASVTIEPELQPGNHLQVYLNGAMYPQWPDGATSYTLSGLDRGSYTLAVRVLDDNQRTLCSGPAISFHVRQPSVLSPQSPLRPQPKQN